MIEPPSVTVGVAERLTVVTSMSSGTVVEAAVVLNARLSKVVPPATEAMLCDTVLASMYASSVGAATVAVPVVWPEAIVIVAPPLRVTVTAFVAAFVSDAV